MSDQMQARLAAFVDRLASAAGSLVERDATLAAGELTPARLWTATLAAGGAEPGRCTVWIDHAGAAALAALALGTPGDVEDASVADLIRKLVSQAAADAATRSDDVRLDLTLTSVEPAAADAPDASAVVRSISVDGLEQPVVVATAWSDALPDATAPRAATVGGDMGSRIDVILDIDLPVVVRFGHTELPIRTLSRLGPGSVIDLGRSPDDPVEVLVSNRVVARGEVVIVGGNYGVRIVDVTSVSERARSLEA